MLRKAIHFKSDNEILRGWLYTPDPSFFPAPVIIMTPGFSCWKEHGLDPFARTFSQSGFLVLAYDNRNFGESDGQPRNEVDPIAQINDIKSAISFAQSLETADVSKIGLWGVSLSARNAIKVATQDSRVKCMCLQVPFLQGMRERTDHFIEKILATFPDKDISSITIPVTSLDVNSFALMKQTSCYDFLTSVKTWPNEVTLQSIKNVAHLDVTDQASHITIPTLFIIAENDTVASNAASLKLYEKIAVPKKYFIIQGEHFAPWENAFDECCQEEITWFKRYLT